MLSQAPASASAELSWQKTNFPVIFFNSTFVPATPVMIGMTTRQELGVTSKKTNSISKDIFQIGGRST